MFGLKKKKKRKVRTQQEICEEMTVGFVEMASEQIVRKLTDEAVAVGQRNLNEVLKARENIDSLEQQQKKLRAELAELKSSHKIKETEIKALIKITEEKSALELERKEVALKGEYKDKEMELLKEYHEKLTKALAEQDKKLGKFMEDVMGVLKQSVTKAVVSK